MPLGLQEQIQVLHVDDDPSITDLTETFLERESDQFTVETATSADEGLEIIDDNSPDCVVSDYNMPGMDGLEFLQAVRDEYPDLPFILFTGKGSEAVASDAISAGVTDYLQKESGTSHYTVLANRISNAVEATRSAAKAEQRRHRLEQILKTVPGCVVQCDANGQFVFANERAEEVLGLDTDEVTQRAYNDPEWELQDVNGEPIPDEELPFRRACDAGEPIYNAKHTVTWPDGSRKILSVNAAPLFDETGDVESVVASLDDITDRRDRQRQLRLLQQAIDDANVSITLADPSQPDEPLVYVNSAFEETTGYSPEETLGNNCRFLQGENTNPEKVSTLREAIDNEEPVTIELRNYRKDGTEFWNRLTVTPIYDDDGQLVRYLGTQEDVTERNERERQLTELNQASQDLLRADNKKEVADIGIRAAREILDLKANAIHLSEADDTQLTPVAQTDELVSLLGDVHPLPVADSIAGRVYERGEPTVIEDVRQDPNVHNPETNLRGHVYLPLDDHGILIAGSEERAAFDQHDIALGELLAGNLVAALDRIDRKQTARKQRHQLSLFYEESPLGAVQWDDDFQVERLNERGEEILGYSEAELRGKSWETIVADEDRDREGDAVENLLAADGGTSVLNTNVRKDGKTRTCKWHNRAVTDADGNVQAIFSKFEDITDQEERKRELQEIKNQYQTLVDNFPNGAVFLYDTDLRVVRTGGSELFEVGLSTEEIEGTTPHGRYPPEISDELVRHIESAVAGNSHTFHQTYDGEHYRVQIAPVRTDDGEITHVMAVSQNITEQTERQRELEQYERIVENLDDVATIIQSDGTITYVSPSVGRLLGYEPAELLGENGFEYQPPETRDAVADAIEHVLENPDDTHTVQTRFRQADGSWCWIESTLRNHRDDPVIDGILVSSRDITQRRQQKKSLQNQNERLEEFTSVVSHDLRNPLTVAEGHLELAQETCESDRLAQATDAIDRSQALIEDLLTLAREGNDVSEAEPVALIDVAESSWQTVESQSATLETHATQTIQADRSRLKQLFENLFRNAVEHGGDNVTVSVGPIDGGFYVADTGPGIPEDDREEVFEAGYSTSEEGTGFGLRIVEQVADAHGWEVAVTESEQGGARFDITGIESADQ